MLLETNNIGITFGGLKALENISIKVDDKVAIVFFKNNFIIKKGENENNYKIFIKENEDFVSDYIN